MEDVLEMIHLKKRSAVVTAIYVVQEAYEMDGLIQMEKVWMWVVMLPEI